MLYHEPTKMLHPEPTKMLNHEPIKILFSLSYLESVSKVRQTVVLLKCGQKCFQSGSSIQLLGGVGGQGGKHGMEQVGNVSFRLQRACKYLGKLTKLIDSSDFNVQNTVNV